MMDKAGLKVWEASRSGGPNGETCNSKNETSLNIWKKISIVEVPISFGTAVLGGEELKLLLKGN